MADVRFLDDALSDAVITVRWRRLFGLLPPKVKQYRGSCTCWIDMTAGRGVGTLTESRLFEFWQIARWKEEDARSSGDANG